MDGRITALRVGFLSSSHQLAGLNFLLPALRKTIQGLFPFLGIFGIVLTAVVGLLSGRFDFGVGVPFPPSVVLREFRQESWRCKSCTTMTGSFGDKCLVFLSFVWRVFPSVPHQKLGLPTGRTEGRRGCNSTHPLPWNRNAFSSLFFFFFFS